MNKRIKVVHLFSIFILMMSLFFLVSTASSESRSMNGGTVDHGHPAIGMVGEMHDDKAFNCTGTLIGKRTVLTAAHCFETGTDGKFHIGGQEYRGQAILHPEFNMNDIPDHYKSDLAIIKLYRDVIGITPVSLCQAQRKIDRLPVTLVGFGVTGIGATDYGTKRSMRSSARGSFNNYILIAGGNQSRLHRGDSGGPALIETNTTECVVGVGATIDKDTFEMSHFRPDWYKDWINGTSSDVINWIKPGELRCHTDTEGYEYCRNNDYWRCFINPGESDADGYLECSWGRKPNNGCSEDICH